MVTITLSGPSGQRPTVPRPAAVKSTNTAIPSPTATAVTARPQPSLPPAVPSPLVRPLQLGPSLSLWPPVLAAPMAGISSAPYRQICTAHGAALATSEMVIASTLLTRSRRALKQASFDPQEAIRSVQLYGVRPDQIEQAVRILVSEHGVRHVDLNFGCPVRKVTARGGGSALPLRPKLFARLVAAAVAGAKGEAPVTVKLRVGLTQALKTHVQSGRIAEAEGAAALTLHARTANQLYSSPVDWTPVRELVDAVHVPVIGNGDVYDGGDALRMLAETGCAGVMVGRAALGRPWVFREVAAALEGLPPPPPPALGSAAAMALKHLEAEAAWFQDYDDEERRSILRFRKYVSLYLYGFTSAHRLRTSLMAAETVHQWREAVYDTSLYDRDEPFPACAVRHPRLKGGAGVNPQRMGLPNGWLDEEKGGGAEAEGRLTDEACEG